MADQIVHGAALGVRDIPGKGMQVRVDGMGLRGLLLEPSEAAELGQALIAQAEEAVHASRARRRDVPRCPACRAGLPTHDEGDPQCELLRVPKTCRYPSLSHGLACVRPEGHTGRHGSSGQSW